MNTSYSAPAKVILFGEHAAVYGKPAIAVPVSSLRASASVHPEIGGKGLHIEALDLAQVLPVTVDSDLMDNALIYTARQVLKTLNAHPPDATIRLSSQIPMASGLGSGAAVSTALARAVAGAIGKPLSDETLNTLIFEIEKLYHGTPSGIDNTVIVYERPVYFIKGMPIQSLNIGTPFRLVIGDTGEAGITRVAVGDVRTLYDANPRKIMPILDEIGNISVRAKTIIENGDPDDLGVLMTRNHELLRELTVSAPSLEKLITVALNAGALGAKLSGGGRGGNIIALVYHNKAEMVKEALLQAGAKNAFITTIE
ncbi:MAG: mevalonate kinase [bacterium]|nr:mevalonate kinase [bacterium]